MSRVHSILTLAAATALAAAGSADAPRPEEVSMSIPSTTHGVGGGAATFPEVRIQLRSTKPQKVADSETSASKSLSDLREGNARWQESIKSLEVQFNMICDEPFKTTKVLEKEKATGGASKEHETFQIVFAMKGERLFQQMIPESGDKNKAQPIFFNGSDTRTFFADRLWGNRRPGRVRGLWGMGEMFTYLVGLAPPDDPQMLKSKQHLPYFLRHEKILKVLPRLETVDDAPCHVVDCGIHTYWIDAAKDCILRRAVHFRGGSLDNPGGYVAELVQLSDYRKINGVWMPFLLSQHHFTAEDEPEHRRGYLYHVQRLEVAKASVNSVPDSRFEFTYPPGTIVVDEVENRHYTMPYGVEHLDRVIAEGDEIKEGVVVVKGRRSLTLLSLGAAGFLSVGALAVWFYSRNR